jgi:thiosulfate/3-mercaptopyruvate sulfurtransferase
MFALRRVQNLPFLLFSVLISLCGISEFLLSPLGIHGDEKKPVDPWPSSQTLPASGLASELADKNGTPPTVVYVGFRTLFAGGHIAGASFNGTASTDEGLTSLKEWVEHLPRSTNLVIYCGCCPFDKCPNIRPAYTALSNMGFKKVRVLVLPTNFATDWVDKGYPIQKGM